MLRASPEFIEGTHGGDLGIITTFRSTELAEAFSGSGIVHRGAEVNEVIPIQKAYDFSFARLKRN
jgi:hypothetical protein